MKPTLAALALFVVLALPAGTSAAEGTVEAPTSASFLVITKSPIEAVVEPGSTILSTTMVTNRGTEPAKSPKLVEVLPIGFTFKENGGQIVERTFLNDLQPGETFAASYEILVGGDIANDTYKSRATVAALNHGAVSVETTFAVRQQAPAGESSDATLQALDEGQEQKTGQVLGATTLPATGVPKATVIALAAAFGLLAVGGTFMTLAQRRGRLKARRA